MPHYDFQEPMYPRRIPYAYQPNVTYMLPLDLVHESWLTP